MKTTLRFVLSLGLAVCSVARAEFSEQPNTYASSLTTNSGLPVYDWEFANMIKMWIAQPGYDSALFFFAQCFGGGMLDDLREKLLRTNGDFAGASASSHDEKSWGLSDGSTIPGKGFNKPEDYWAKELGEEMAKTGADSKTASEMADTAANEDLRGPNGTKKEKPQSTSLRNGGNVKLGKKADGTAVASRHAIMFMGKPNGERHWNDLDRAHDALKAQGFTDGEIVVLAGDGATKSDGSAAPAYVDGSATKQTLFDAIKAIGPMMNPNEQFVFWSSDHGNRERTETALNRVITEPNRQTVPPANYPELGLWSCDRRLVASAQIKDAERFVSIVVDEHFAPSQCPLVKLYFNRVPLELIGVGPIEGYDDDPDIDGTELLYAIPHTAPFKTRNRIEIEWVGGVTTPLDPFLIRAVQIGVNVPTVPERATR